MRYFLIFAVIVMLSSQVINTVMINEKGIETRHGFVTWEQFFFSQQKLDALESKITTLESKVTTLGRDLRRMYTLSIVGVVLVVFFGSLLYLNQLNEQQDTKVQNVTEKMPGCASNSMHKKY